MQDIERMHKDIIVCICSYLDNHSGFIFARVINRHNQYNNDIITDYHTVTELLIMNEVPKDIGLYVNISRLVISAEYLDKIPRNVSKGIFFIKIRPFTMDSKCVYSFSNFKKLKNIDMRLNDIDSESFTLLNKYYHLYSKYI